MPQSVATAVLPRIVAKACHKSANWWCLPASEVQWAVTKRGGNLRERWDNAVSAAYSETAETATQHPLAAETASVPHYFDLVHKLQGTCSKVMSMCAVQRYGTCPR